MKPLDLLSYSKATMKSRSILCLFSYPVTMISYLVLSSDIRIDLRMSSGQCLSSFQIKMSRRSMHFFQTICLLVQKQSQYHGEEHLL